MLGPSLRMKKNESIPLGPLGCEDVNEPAHEILVGLYMYTYSRRPKD